MRQQARQARRSRAEDIRFRYSGVLWWLETKKGIVLEGKTFRRDGEGGRIVLKAKTYDDLYNLLELLNEVLDSPEIPIPF